MVVLRLYPIQHSATGQLGPIRLIGYELTEESVEPGESLPFHLYWQATAATEADYQVFNHLLDDAGNLVAQADGPPLPDPLLRRGTGAWDDPEEILYSREYVLTLPEDLAPVNICWSPASTDAIPASACSARPARTRYG